MTCDFTYRWPEERIATLTRFWQRGLSVQIIADALNTTRGTIIAARKRFGLEPRRAGYPGGGRPRKPPEPSCIAMRPEPAPGWPTRAQLMARR